MKVRRALAGIVFCPVFIDRQLRARRRHPRRNCFPRPGDFHRSTAPFSTASGNELLLAFISTDYLSGANSTVTGVSGGGFTWILVRRTNFQSGASEIWRAFTTSTLNDVTVTATISQSVSCSMTVMSFGGVDTTATNVSGAIGATGTANSSRGAPTAQPDDYAE